jgi:hypothetical protein
VIAEKLASIPSLEQLIFSHHSSKFSILKTNKGVAQAIECLVFKHKTLSSNSSPTEKLQNKKQKKIGKLHDKP